ncbi:hypothetical protein RHGRI_031674 [Rhododendron griersonianum]|uniref:Uncharacterized protein n=1 Tax=Rhododendron griersonianum TaxID=479676 RepID=A0AAV6I971_9ERIC|nr:hypothetical protein RHGRI_031674 [Rhododendron griersonianum]
MLLFLRNTLKINEIDTSSFIMLLHTVSRNEEQEKLRLRGIMGGSRGTNNGMDLLSLVTSVLNDGEVSSPDEKTFSEL